MDGANTGIPCLGLFGGPAITNLVYGGYNGENFESAESILITIPLNNHLTNNTAALAWEKEFLNYMKVRTSFSDHCCNEDESIFYVLPPTENI